MNADRMIPAVTFLKMERDATGIASRLARRVQRSSGMVEHEPSHLHLSHVVWMRPLVVGLLPVTVHITLEPQNNTTIAFFISREGSQEPRERTDPSPTLAEEEERAQIYCQGRAELRTESTVQSLDLVSIQARCHRQISVTGCYQRMHSLGISYGPAQQAIERMAVGEGEGLARLRLPAVVAQTHSDFVLHPSVLDAALQSCIWLLIESVQLQGPWVPFTLEELSIVGEVPPEGWAWARRRQISATGQVFDVEVCDDVGRIALLLRGFS